MKPHRHAEILRAIADGKEIQIRATGPKDEWVDWEEEKHFHPLEKHNCEYRIKPEPPKYPQTKMTDEEMQKAANPLTPHMYGQRWMDEARNLANATIIRAIKDGDVVPTSIYDRAIRALKRNGFVDNGAEEWKPPVTNLAEEMVPEALLDKLYDSAMEAAVARMLAKSLEGDIGRGTSYRWRGLLHELLTIDKDAIIEAVKQGK